MRKSRIININIIIYSVLLFGYFVMAPFYFYESGLPKISDFLLLFIFFILLISKDLRINKTYQIFLFLGVLFTGYVFLVNSIWIFIYPSIDFVLSSTYYIYNFVACLVILGLYQKLRERLFKLIFICLLFSVGIQFLLSFFIESGSYRETLFFNSPNQLGNFAIASLAILLVLSEKININKFLILITIIMCFVLAALSLSKAAIISFCIMLPLFFTFSKKTFNIRGLPFNILIFFTIILIVGTVIPNDSELFKDNELVSKMHDRISSTGKQADDTLEARGYDRIFDYPQYILFGAGEGEHDRFKSGAGGKEIHSLLGNTLFSYGMIGLALFLVWILYSLYRQRTVQIIPIIALFISGLTHNNIRDTFLWILITIVFVDKINNYDKWEVREDK